MSDEELVRRLLAGDRSAREALARRHAPQVLAVCRAKAGRDAAEDLAQETLIRGLRSVGTLGDPGRLAAWLRGIARHVCADWARRRPGGLRFSELSPAADFAADAAGPAEAAAASEETDDLRAAVEGLPPDLRETLLLFYYDDLTYDQIAAALGVARATVNARLAKARAALARRLRPHDTRTASAEARP